MQASQQKQQEKKLSHMRILMNLVVVVFLIILATHNFALRKEMSELELDITSRELVLKNSIRELRLEEKKWRQGYSDFEANKVGECKKILGIAAPEAQPQ